MTKPWYSVCLSLALIVGVINSQAETTPTAIELLDSMTHASTGLNFDGTFVYIRGDQVNSMRVIHKASQDGEFERLVAQSGAAREVIRDRETVTCIFPDNKAGMMEERSPGKLFPSLQADKLQVMSAFYNFRLMGMDRVAGRATWVVNVSPKGAHRYGYRFWIDTQKHLLLRSNLVDLKGRILEQIMFTSISYPDLIDDRLLMPALSGKGYTWHLNDSDTLAQKQIKVRWDVSWLPVGFALHGHEVHRLSASDMPVDHMVYSDGLATISVFVEEIKNPSEVMIGYSVLGAVNTFSAMSNGYQVTVVGEVPPRTIRQIADSLRMIQ